MTLLELLVQELPKRGGWPEGYKFMSQDKRASFAGNIYAYETCPANNGDYWTSDDANGYGEKILHHAEISEDSTSAIVTREQYEAALTDAHQPAWNGEGLPPVGTECEFFNGNRYYTRESSPEDGQKVKVIHHEISGAGIPCAVFVWIGEDKSVKSEAAQEGLFRPIRSEADKKRDEAVTEMLSVFGSNAATGTSAALKAFYDAIAAGKIPGVKLED